MLHQQGPPQSQQITTPVVKSAAIGKYSANGQAPSEIAVDLMVPVHFESAKRHHESWGTTKHSS